MSVGPAPGDGRPGGRPRRRAAQRQGRGQGDGLGRRRWRKSGATTSTETYDGVTITLVEPAAGAPTPKADMKAAYAVVGPVLAIGDPTSVKAVIDTERQDGPQHQRAVPGGRGSVTGDRLGFAYVDLATLAKSATDLAGPVTERRCRALPISLEGLTPPWVAGAVRAEDGAFVMESRSPHMAAIGPGEQRRVQAAGRRAADHGVPRRGPRRGQDPHLGQGPARPTSPSSRSPSPSWTTRSRSSAAPRPSPAGSARPASRSRSTATEIAGGPGHRPDRCRRRPSKLLSQLKALIQLGGAQAGLSVTEEAVQGRPRSPSSTCPGSAAWSARCRRAPSRPRPTSSSPMP